MSKELDLNTLENASGGTVYWAEENGQTKYFVNGTEYDKTIPAMMADMNSGRSHLNQVKCLTFAAAKAASATEKGLSY